MNIFNSNTTKTMALDNIVELDCLCVHQDDILILSEISLTIKKGEFVYLVGRTGSGKTSLLKTLYADLPVQQGTASITGYSLNNIKNKEIPYLRRKIGIIFQDFQLLMDRTVNENLLFTMKATGWKDKNAMQLRVQEVLEKVGLVTKGFKMPNQLSGGEQQRVVIARALINDPDIIIADEPTGNLDPETSAEIIKILWDISKNGRAVLMATHKYDFIISFPSRILKCDRGHLYDSLTSDFKVHETVI